MTKAVDIQAELATRPFLHDRCKDTDADAAFAELAKFREGAVFAGSFSGESPWERHRNGDELVHVLSGATTLTIMTDDGPETLAMTAGMIAVVPQGSWHRFHSPDGVTVLTATPQPTDHSLAEDPREAESRLSQPSDYRTPMLTALPERIVCLTEETTETLYLLGEQHRIVGISGFTVRPPQARKEKPKVSAFTSAKIDKILALEPDLVLGFSDLQADIAATLIRHGLPVHVFNQRSVAQIFEMIAMLGAMVGASERARELIAHLKTHMDAVKQSAAVLSRRPRIYFEEWDDPLISGIRWVSELIEIAGGIDCFAEQAVAPGAKDRIIGDPTEVVRRQPDIIIGSWCGKKFRPDRVRQRQGWTKIPAVRHGHVYEIKSADILQPGPAALGDGLDRLYEIVQGWAQDHRLLEETGDSEGIRKSGTVVS